MTTSETTAIAATTDLGENVYNDRFNADLDTLRSAGDIKSVVIHYTTWCKLPDIKERRSVVVHAANAKKKHLSQPSVLQLHVSAAPLPDGSLFKLDGRTRAHLWATGELELLEESVTVTVIHAEDYQEAVLFSRTFDAPGAVRKRKHPK